MDRPSEEPFWKPQYPLYGGYYPYFMSPHSFHKYADYQPGCYNPVQCETDQKRSNMPYACRRQERHSPDRTKKHHTHSNHPQYVLEKKSDTDMYSSGFSRLSSHDDRNHEPIDDCLSIKKAPLKKPCCKSSKSDPSVPSSSFSSVSQRAKHNIKTITLGKKEEGNCPNNNKITRIPTTVGVSPELVNNHRTKEWIKNTSQHFKTNHSENCQRAMTHPQERERECHHFADCPQTSNFAWDRRYEGPPEYQGFQVPCDRQIVRQTEDLGDSQLGSSRRMIDQQFKLLMDQKKRFEEQYGHKKGHRRCLSAPPIDQKSAQSYKPSASSSYLIDRPSSSTYCSQCSSDCLSRRDKQGKTTSGYNQTNSSKSDTATACKGKSINSSSESRINQGRAKFTNGGASSKKSVKDANGCNSVKDKSFNKRKETVKSSIPRPRAEAVKSMYSSNLPLYKIYEHEKFRKDDLSSRMDSGFMSFQERRYGSRITSPVERIGESDPIAHRTSLSSDVINGLADSQYGEKRNRSFDADRSIKPSQFVPTLQTKQYHTNDQRNPTPIPFSFREFNNNRNSCAVNASCSHESVQSRDSACCSDDSLDKDVESPRSSEASCDQMLCDCHNRQCEQNEDVFGHEVPHEFYSPEASYSQDREKNQHCPCIEERHYSTDNENDNASNKQCRCFPITIKEEPSSEEDNAIQFQDLNDSLRRMRETTEALRQELNLIRNRQKTNNKGEQTETINDDTTGEQEPDIVSVNTTDNDKNKPKAKQSLPKVTNKTRASRLIEEYMSNMKTKNQAKKGIVISLIDLFEF